jgi:cytochrome c-type biogenesis protein CcmH
MASLFFAIFLILVIAAVGFAAWPLLHGASRGRALLIAALASLILALGLGCYLLLGSPALALRSLTGPSSDDVRGLVATLATRVRQTPNDPRGWTLLGRGYLTLNDPSDAAAAFRRAIPIAPPSQHASLLSAYAESLTLAAQGEVTPEAEAAFMEAFRENPNDHASQFYLGQVAARRGDRNRALALWSSLVSEIPPGDPLHGMLVDRIAMLSAQMGAAPDVHAMVESLVTRLKSNPQDGQGWQRLIRAYVVLGEKEKAQAALKDARAALKNDASALSAIEAEARNAGL